jgi:type VI secretion system protein ImpE
MATPSAEDLLAAGDPAGALKALQQQVRGNASNAKLRTFLFQLLAVLGQWPRALDQLKVCGELDAGTLAMVNTYTSALQCEGVREAVFAGTTLPHIFGPPTQWVALLVQALQIEAGGDSARGAQTRQQALDLAPGTPGSMTPAKQPDAPLRFEWLADADSRLGPVLEVIINGRYGWLPFMHLQALQIEPVEDLRDLIWAPAHLTFTNGGDTVALLPVRYAGTPLAEGGSLAMARQTQWLAMTDAASEGPPQYRGLGQRMWATDSAELGLLEIGQVVFDTTAAAQDARHHG